MIQRRENSCLTLESREPLGVASKCVRESFDGDVPPEVGVERTIHFAHSTRADASGDFVRTETNARHKGHGNLGNYRRVAGRLAVLFTRIELGAGEMLTLNKAAFALTSCDCPSAVPIIRSRTARDLTDDWAREIQCSIAGLANTSATLIPNGTTLAAFVTLDAAAMTSR